MSAVAVPANVADVEHGGPSRGWVTGLLAAFPGSELVDDPTGDQRRQRASDYLRRLWKGAEGWAALAAGTPSLEGGKYDHGNTFRQRFYRWPDDAGRIAASAVATADAGRDVWVAPMLRSSQVRRKGSGIGGRHAWADIDGPWTADRQARLVDIAGPGSFLVDSGTGRHLYVALGSWSDPDAVVEMNVMLRDVFHADAKFSDESLLRLPGTLNHKPSTFGTGDQRPVQVVDEW